MHMVDFSNFERWGPWSPEKDAMEPWSTAILPLGARCPLKYALETQSPRSLRAPCNRTGNKGSSAKGAVQKAML